MFLGPLLQMTEQILPFWTIDSRHKLNTKVQTHFEARVFYHSSGQAVLNVKDLATKVYQKCVCRFRLIFILKQYGFNSTIDGHPAAIVSFSKQT
jgi:hypothetical protein